MASILCALIVLPICLSQDYMGIQGIHSTVFSSVGGKATLPCDNAVHQDRCSSTSWIYNSYASSQSILVFIFGKIHSDVPKPRAERLSLLPNCSLHITDVTTEDAGLYTCRQYVNEDGPPFVKDHRVHLSVLHGRFFRDSPHSSGVHVAVRVATTISLFVAVITVTIIHRKRSGDPQGEPNTSAHSGHSAAASQAL